MDAINRLLWLLCKHVYVLRLLASGWVPPADQKNGFVSTLRHLNVLLYGPKGVGKTQLSRGL